MNNDDEVIIIFINSITDHIEYLTRQQLYQLHIDKLQELYYTVTCVFEDEPTVEEWKHEILSIIKY